MSGLLYSGAGVEGGLQEAVPDFVAVVLEGQVVIGEQIFAGFTFGIQAWGPGIDEGGERVRFAEFADELIGFDGLIANCPAFDAGFDAEEYVFAAAGLLLCFVEVQLVLE
ncbi:MAG: hypothetical protein ACK5BP_19900 [Planctomyces sp.]